MGTNGRKMGRVAEIFSVKLTQSTFNRKSIRLFDAKIMDPYAAQWAHYGYAISAPADASATAATAAQAAYPAYYNYQQAAQAAQAGNSVAHQAAHHAAVKPPPPHHQRQRTLTPVRPQVLQTQQPPPMPGTQTYYPTKAFVKAGADGTTSTGQEYDAANSVMRLHQLALHNHLADVYEKAESALPQMQAVKAKLGTEEFIGMGTTFKAAKQDCATKALADSKL